MKRTKGKPAVVLLGMIVLAMVCTSATVLAAPATKEPFTVTMKPTGMEAPERAWVDEEGVSHVRGCDVTLSVTGDIVGTAIITVNWDYVFSGGGVPSGYAQGKGTITSGADAYLVYIDVTVTLGMDSGTFVIRGTGSCKGIHITGTLSGPGSQPVLTGTKLTTHP